MNCLVYGNETYLKKNSIYSMPTIFFIFYKIIFEIAYIVVHNIYYVDGSSAYGLSFNEYKFLFSYLLLFILIMFLPKIADKFSSIVTYLLFCFIMIPILSVYALNNQSTICVGMLSLGFIMQCLVITHTKNISAKKVVNANGILKLLLYAITILLFGYFLIIKGLPTLTALDIYKVYTLRSAMDMNKYIAYLFNLQIYVIGPFLICLSLNKKKYLALTIFSGIQFVFYLWTGHKIIIFNIMVVFLIYIISKIKKTEKIILSVLFIIIIFCIVCIIFIPLNKSFELPLSLLVRRAMILPAQLKFDYFDFFTVNPKLGLTGIFPTWIWEIHNPYSGTGFTYLIGDIYYNAPLMNANTGYFIEGFARFGYAGFYIVFILMGFILKLFDAFAEKAGKMILYPLCLYFFLAFNDGFLIDELFIKGKIFFMAVILLLYDFDYDINLFKERNKSSCQIC